MQRSKLPTLVTKPLSIKLHHYLSRIPQATILTADELGYLKCSVSIMEQLISSGRCELSKRLRSFQIDCLLLIVDIFCLLSEIALSPEFVLE